MKAVAAALALGTIAVAVAAGAQSSSPGADAFVANCAGCHGATLGGGFGPPLKGAGFVSRWGAKPPAALEAFIRSAMPPGNPGELPPAVYHDITDYILKQNGLAAGGPAKATSTATATDAPGGEAAPATEHGRADAPRFADSVSAAAMARRSSLADAMRPVSQAMLANPDPGDWINWRRTYDANATSPLDRINRGNVAQLKVAWAASLPAGTNEITPLVHDGLLFVDSNSTVLAFDLASGDQIWRYARPAPVSTLGSPISQPRGMAIYGETLFVPTNDNHMVALDMRTGNVVWDHLIEHGNATLRITAGPMVVHGKVIQGMSGCSGTTEPGGCFLVALDVHTGRELWRAGTIAKPGSPGGDSWNGAPFAQRFGGSIWSTATYDAASNLIFIGTAQTYHAGTLLDPAPTRPHANDALFTDSTLAIDPETGRVKWTYQHLARDVWDLDWSFERTLATIPVKGKPRRVVMTMGKIGVLDILDAATGQYVSSVDAGLQTLVSAIDPKTGAKTISSTAEPVSGQDKLICPYVDGARNWPATAFDQRSGLLYVGLTRACMTYRYAPSAEWDISFGLAARPASDGLYGAYAAIDVASGRIAWQRNYRSPPASSMLLTAGDLLFAGSHDRMLRAFDPATGSELWSMHLDNSISSSPITALANHKQYVVVTTGGGAPNDIDVQPLTPELPTTGHGTTLWVFKL